MATATATGLPNGLPTETPPATVTPPSIHSSLYVGDLDRDVEERSLFELFSQVKTLVHFPALHHHKGQGWFSGFVQDSLKSAASVVQ